MKALWLVVLAGCAKGGSGLSDAPSNVVDSPEVVDTSEAVDAKVDAALHDASMVDTSVMIDAAPDAMVDAMVDAMADAKVDAMADAMVDAAPMIDAMVDAAPMIDAKPDAAPMIDACVPVTTEVLQNPAFDLAPRGTDWTELPFDPSLDLITNDAGTPAAQSLPYRAWLGGVIANDIGETATDELYQDVTIPANTTKLELTGFYAVGTDETTTTNVYDTGDLSVVHTNESPLEEILPLTNLSKTTVAWTPIDYTFSTNLSGQTVRLRFLANNDFSNATSFFFDTLSLKATHCP